MLEILARITLGSVLDIGASRGWYALMAAKRAASTVAIDTNTHYVTSFIPMHVPGHRKSNLPHRVSRRPAEPRIKADRCRRRSRSWLTGTEANSSLFSQR